MLPLLLAPNSVTVGVVGRGSLLAGRQAILERAGFTQRRIFDDRLPSAEELAELDILFVAGLDEGEARALHQAAKANGTLVNVEDVPKLCDFHVPAQIRRGDLLITVSTAGRSPGLSAALREFLSETFDEEWESHLDEIGLVRARWRSSGLSPQEVAIRTRDYIAAKGWLGGPKKGTE
jgi:precorrin-2 dehydrogenase/sirohydrochlorin ferrochelatase